MRIRVTLSMAAAIVVPLLACGCGPHSSTAINPIAHPQPVAHQSVPAGPGPTGTYTVQPQPAPGSCHYGKSASGEPLPDANCTPGATNPKVTADNVKSTICVGGYTKSIRPPEEITSREKSANAKSYGYTGSPHDAEYDHLISLELGGDPNDPRNLWVEPPSPGHKAGSGPNNPKDSVENQLHSLVCSGKVGLTDAQSAIAGDWTTAMATVGHPGGK